MGKRHAPALLGQVVHLILRGSRPQTLVQTDDDWDALDVCAARMLFWCGGAILACRCEGTEIHFAVQVAHAPIGDMAQHFSAAYAAHLWNRRRWDGVVFKHYWAAPLADEVFLDDLVLWLHWPARSASPGRGSGPLFTGEAAYLAPPALPWITTRIMLPALGARALTAAYRRRQAQPIAEEVLRLLMRQAQPKARTTQIGDRRRDPERSTRQQPSIETIAQVVASHCQVSLGDMRSRVRRRAVGKAKVIATVLCTRNGWPAAAAARLFNRSRSTLTEQAERYRRSQPEIFTAAEAALDAFLEDGGCGNSQLLRKTLDALCSHIDSQ